MANQDLAAIDSTVQTHEWLGALVDASQRGKARHVAVLVAGHVLIKFAVAVIPVVIILGLSVLVIAAFVGGYLAALR